MKRFIAGVASAALAGALLLSVPAPTYAAETIDGVPASVSWGTGVVGTEKRVLFTTNDCNLSATHVHTCISWKSTVPFTPTLGISNLCNQVPYGPFTDTTCSNSSPDLISRAAMKWAADSNSKNNTSSNLGTQCTARQPGMFVVQPNLAGTGVQPIATATLCTNSPIAADTIWVRELYLAVTVPSGTNAGLYKATITVGIQ